MVKSVIGILGFGEVGSAIKTVFVKNFVVLKKDFNFDEIKNSKIDILHICIPYSGKFEKIVLDQVSINKPKLTIIHSTVKPGTTQNIFKKSKISIVHSPVMGTHPNLAKDIINFKKIIGPIDKKSANLANIHFRSVGINTETFNNSLESEIAKLLDTTYYGWNIIFTKIVWEICKKTGVRFENVYETLNKVYNTGYKKSKPNVLRPVLKYQPGKIGGHCIIPNAQILDDYAKNIITTVVLAENKKLKSPK